MERVVSWPGENGEGFINIHWFKPDRHGMSGRPFKTLDDFMGMVGWASTHPQIATDIYYCLSTQEHRGKKYGDKWTASRTAQHALALKAIWLDIDVKAEKGYATVEEAIDALTKCCEASGLPSPSALVLSGSGVHAYWISDTKLSVDEWRPYAQGLREVAEQAGLRFDAGLTTDPARVLRVPGSLNWKTTPPKPVKLAHLGQSYNFKTEGFPVATGAVTATPPTANVTRPGQHFAGPASAFAELPVEQLGEDLLSRDDRPLSIDGILSHCPHFNDTARTSGAKCGQGLWMLDVLASTFMENGRAMAHALSKGFSGYTAVETDAMYDRKTREKEEKGLGWPSCSSFAREGSIHCKTCPFNGKIRSPLNLGERVSPKPGAPFAPSPAKMTAEHDMLLPDGYIIDKPTGYIFYLQKDKDGDTVPMQLFQCRLRKPEALGGTAKQAGIRFDCSLDLDNWGPVTVYDSALASNNETLQMLRNAKCKTYVPNENRIRHFMSSWMEKLDAEKKRLTTMPYGWVREDNNDMPVGFAYGGKVFRSDGTTTSAGASDPKLAETFTPRGRIEPWLEALKMITDQHHPALEATVALSFAAPLMWVPQQYNGVLCVWSHKGGTHKSTSVAVGLSVWGNPQLAKENKLSSIKGTIKKLGHLQNLPVYLDEINRPSLMKQVQEFLDIATEGRGGTVLHQDRTTQAVDSWQTLVGVGANCSLWDQILRSNASSDAQLQRVFEIEVENRGNTVNQLYAEQLIGSLNQNYGQMGLRYAELLARNPEVIHAHVSDIIQAFLEDIGDDSGERFRVAMVGTMVAGASLANSLGATFNVPELYQFLKQEFIKQNNRIKEMTTIAGTLEHTNNLLSEFFSEISDGMVWTSSMHTGKGKPGPVTQEYGPEKHRPVYGRCVIDSPRVAISKKRWHRFCKEHNYGLLASLENLQKFYNMTENRLDLTSGTSYVGGREQVLEIPAPPGSDLEELVFRQTPDKRPAPPPTAMERLEAREAYLEANTPAAVGTVIKSNKAAILTLDRAIKSEGGE